MRSLLFLALAAVAVLAAGCATPQAAATGERAEEKLTGSRLGRRERWGSEYTRTIVQDGMTRAEEINRGNPTTRPMGN